MIDAAPRRSGRDTGPRAEQPGALTAGGISPRVERERGNGKKLLTFFFLSPRSLLLSLLACLPPSLSDPPRAGEEEAGRSCSIPPHSSSAFSYGWPYPSLLLLYSRRARECAESFELATTRRHPPRARGRAREGRSTTERKRSEESLFRRRGGTKTAPLSARVFARSTRRPRRPARRGAAGRGLTEPPLLERKQEEEERPATLFRFFFCFGLGRLHLLASPDRPSASSFQKIASLTPGTSSPSKLYCESTHNQKMDQPSLCDGNLRLF